MSDQPGASAPEIVYDRLDNMNCPACGALVDGFEVPGLLYAVLTAILINTVCAVAARK